MRIYEKLQPLAGNMNPARIRGNVATSLELELSELLTPDNIGKSGDPETTVCIVNPGPSARTEEALAFLNGGVDENGKPLLIILAGSGYGMLDRGLTRAHVCVMNHPDSHFAKIPKMGDADIDYWVASMAAAGTDPENPSIFDLLATKGRLPQIWHAHLSGVQEFGDEKVSVGTGSGAPVAALAIASAMGYRKFRIFGMDGSNAYAVDLGDAQVMRDYLERLEAGKKAVKVDDRIFEVAEEFWPQTQEVLGFVRDYPNAVYSLHFSGDTANAAIFNTQDGEPRPYQVLQGMRQETILAPRLQS